MSASVQNALKDQFRPNRQTANGNLSGLERLVSLAAGAVLLAVGLRRDSKLHGLMMAGVGVALANRGVTGHCQLYQALGINTAASPPEEAVAEETASCSEFPSFGETNHLDKERFDKLKATQVARGRDAGEATVIAAEEVKELRRREGRTIEERSTFLDESEDALDRS